jgi:outer membrane protein assembly factor BamA
VAARFALGALLIFDHSALDERSSRLGPQSYRLRGGGANSNRGFLPGRLGDGLNGGTRRWEGSLELRIPLGTDLGVVVFGDVGDVDGGSETRKARFRFSHPNAAAGFGLRYYSILGALRFDAGWRIPGWQVIGPQPAQDVKVRPLPSAMHLTIGEAF